AARRRSRCREQQGAARPHQARPAGRHQHRQGHGPHEPRPGLLERDPAACQVVHCPDARLRWPNTTGCPSTLLQLTPTSSKRLLGVPAPPHGLRLEEDTHNGRAVLLLLIISVELAVIAIL